MRASGVVALAVFAAMSFVAHADEFSSTNVNPAAFTWTGFYAGLNVGWADTRNNVSIDTDPIPNNALHPNARTVLQTFGTGEIDDDDVIIGGQIGYNVQLGNLVLGVEADLSGLASDGERTVSRSVVVDNGPANNVTLHDSVEAEFLATIRGRIGWAVNRRTLFYGTGGVAFTHLNFDRQIFIVNDGCPVGSLPCHSGSNSQSMTGWTAGGGVEHAILNNLTIKFEYLYSKFDDDVSFVTRNALAPPNITQLLEHTADLDSIQVFRIGINAKF